LPLAWAFAMGFAFAPCVGVRDGVRFAAIAGIRDAPRGASVAPVRGGTYFLCRGKESKQRKPLTPSMLDVYPRALGVPALHMAAC
jgi:hypothetical protein